MAEFFKGLFQSKDEKALDKMLNDYAKGGTVAHRETAEMVRTALEYSPDLRARTLEMIHDHHLRSYESQGVQVGGSASYHVSDGSIRMPAARDPSGGRNVPVDLIFTLGHETEHARSQRGVNYIETTLGPAMVQVATSVGPGPRDYTDVVEHYVERTRAEEGRAHLGGFNAVASFMREHHPSKPGEFLQDLYEAHPGRMGDFIHKSSYGQPPDYVLKPGLTMDAHGMLPYTAENVEAMKTFYADKAQLGPQQWNYRQDAIETAVNQIKSFETTLAEKAMQDRSYVIDPVRLQADPAQGLPGDGRLTAKGAIEVQSLETLLGSSQLPPLMASSSSAPVLAASSSPPPSLVPTSGDHPLFAQALTKVAELDARDHLGSPQEVRNLAAALAFSAQEHGLHQIDSVSHSVDGKGLIATQGTDETAVSARVEGLAAVSTPESQSLGRLAPVEVPSVASLGQAEVVQGPPSEAQGGKAQHH